ncbi:MAG: ABC transporter permease, partial [Verrucomicrobiota bacterium]
YKGTPKAFLPLEEGQRIWGNRFGMVTALRVAPETSMEDVEEGLKERMKLAEFGMAFLPIASAANLSVNNALDFGALFASLSFFIILAALVLVALLVTFAVEQRSREIGVLRALGFTKKRVRRLFLLEISLVAFDGAVTGALGGLLFTKLALWALSGMWSGAVVGQEFAFGWTWTSVIGGVLGVFIMALIAGWFATRRMLKIEPKDLVAGSRDVQGSEKMAGPVWKSAAFWCVLVGMIGGGVSLAVTPGLRGEPLAGAFFGAGFCFLLAGLGAMAMAFRSFASSRKVASSVSDLGRRHAFRQTSRSLTVAAIMSAGVFLVVAVNAFRLGTASDPRERTSGTGGFDLFGESAFPIFEDLNTVAGREKYGLDDFAADDFSVVPLRVLLQGEEASCLNLNAASRPRLVGVESADLAERGAFHFAGAIPEIDLERSPWASLAKASEDGAIPGIADKASAMWAMHKGLGDVIEYEDGYGEMLKVRLVAFVEGSTLQGSVVIDQEFFKRRFPGVAGYRMFLIETKPETEAEVSAEMTRQFEDYGMEITPSLDRLARYSEVQNTYISIFSSLGGLGVLLGTIGVGLVIGRNVIERRGELALMQAVGFRRERIAKMVVAEHWFLIAAGILLGAAAALVAVTPQADGAGVQWPLLTVIVVLIGGAGIAFCVLASRLAVRGNLMEAIRNE